MYSCTNDAGLRLYLVGLFTTTRIPDVLLFWRTLPRRFPLTALLLPGAQLRSRTGVQRPRLTLPLPAYHIRFAYDGLDTFKTPRTRLYHACYTGMDYFPHLPVAVYCIPPLVVGRYAASTVCALPGFVPYLPT